MTYNELIRAYQKARQHYNPETVTLARAKDDINTFMDVLFTSLTEDDSTNLYGVGTLKVVKTTAPERLRYNPTSGKNEKVAEHDLVKAYFKPCPALKNHMLG
jgi:nucleoid DNA-binding protein